MKKSLVCLLLPLLAFAAGGQVRDDRVAAAADRERENIQSERVALEAKFSAQEALCYKKFFVNACLNAIQAVRQDAMAQLKQREVALNDQQRREKAADQMRKLEEKSSPEAQQQAAERRAKAMDDFRTRQESARSKADARGELQRNEAVNAADSANRLKGAREREQARADKQAGVAEELRIFKAKQQEALERKASNAKRMQEQTKPPANSLPTPK